jgi:hypothetical protein
MPAAARAPVFETQIPSEVPAPLPPWTLPQLAESERAFDAGLWAGEVTEAPQLLAGEPLHDDADAWLAEIMAAPPPEVPAPANGVEVLAAAPGSEAPAEGAGGEATGGDPYLSGWSAVRDANIRPYADWRPAPTISLPVMQVRQQQQQQHQHHNGHGGQQGQHGRHQGQHGRNSGKGYNTGGGNDRGGNDRGGRRRKRRGQDRQQNRNRDRGPRLPGFYNPGGD